ncbi:ABC transporter substrate-binding protein [Leucobacter aridicollis]|uniref:Multiple sugar transport system substrate-binding protein n=1 Tax=Leucobacter aridicollis TaxID=283878 RepID=A0A852RFB8_9MICO|nr:sugar ABC transporter substrate-binding protein [Leucobacter aridicollis]MBL3683174.1 sugar ABC transporter substrate-binding protein [Leucobacter aridicollis]NYD25402.1 multiple sugar transport system substrate-binding protein [Leucobacter aridicollis]
MKKRSQRAVQAVGLFTASAMLLSGCAGFGGGSAEDEGSLTFTAWGSEAEEAEFRDLISQFEAENEGVSVKLNLVPYDQMFSNIDAQLSAGNAPDVFRVDYGNLGVYSSQGQLLDLSDAFSADEIAEFTPAMWEAVSFEGTPYGVPHQTDVSALLVNTKMLADAGIDTASLPQTQEDAWSWEEFGDVATQLRASLPENQYPFVYNWQLAGAARWLSWLFQADGTFTDGSKATIDSAEGERALEFTKSFFDQGWVPPASSTKGTVYADSLFTEGTAAMTFAGSFLVPDIDYLTKFDWTALPMPRDERGATDLGGNALVASKDSNNPELAAEFLKFMVSEEAMAQFCAATNELPTRTALSGDAIEFAVRPDIMPVFVDQAATIEPSDVKQLTSPVMAAVNTALQDQLEAAFVGGQSTTETLANLSAAIEEAAN